jgi:DNA-binding response OmpR family regulator
VRILVVEDEEALATSIAEALRINAYSVDIAHNGTSADQLMFANFYDLAIVDWGIPPPSGIELIRHWRNEGIEIAILMLTARDELDDRIDGLDSGADDYLGKPFELRELLARVRTLLRRSDKSVHVAYQVDNVELDRRRVEVKLDGNNLQLSPKEFALLEYLITRRDEVVSRSEIIEHIWDDSYDSVSNLVDVIVYRLRKKIDGDNPKRLLHTKKGSGYMLSSSRIRPA